MKKLVFYIIVLLFLMTCSNAQAATSNKSIRAFLNTVEETLLTKTKAKSLFTREFLWWNIHYEWNLHDKKWNLKWSNISTDSTSRSTLKKIFDPTNLNAELETINILPTTETYKTSCEIPRKWKNKWLIWNGNYQIDELKKIGFEISQNEEISKHKNKIISGALTILYFNSKGQDLIINLVSKGGLLKINYGGFRQECDT